MEFLKTKVPLWCLLPMFIIIICGGIQIGADARLHSEQRATFIQNARVNASNAESALNFLCSERIEEVRKSYDLEEKFSAEDDSVLRRYRDAYADLAEGLSDGRKLSDGQFADCFSAFAQAIYPHSED